MLINRSSSQSRIVSTLSSALGLPLARTTALLIGCSAAWVCGGSFTLSAQQVQLRTQAGLSLPTRISIPNGMLHVRQKVGMNVGARLRLTFNERFDVVSGVTYVPGYAILRGAGKRVEVGTHSHLLTGTTGARYRLLRPGGMLAWEVHTALGVVFGGRPAYEDLFEGSTVSGIIGTTLRYQVGRILILHLRIQERLYRVRLGGGELGRAGPPLRISFGVGLPFLDSAL
jgi:hypothetical protein